MNIRKKASGIAFTATLLSALVATVAAPMAFASATFTGQVTTPRGGTSTAQTVTFTGVENFASCITTPTGGAPGDELTIQIKDSAGASTVHFTGTPSTVGSIGSLGVTAALGTTVVANDTLKIQFNGNNPLFIETVVVGGLGLSADVLAATGAIGATMTGNQAGCFRPGGTGPADLGTTTATGILNSSTAGGGLPNVGYSAGATVFNIQNTGCPFEITAEGDAPSAGNLKFSTNPEGPAGVGLPVTADNADVIGAGPLFNQPVTVTPASANAHSIGETVTQTGVPNCSLAIGSPGSVANALKQTVVGTPTIVIPGQNNQPTASILLDEGPLGPLVAPFNTLSGTVTFTITTAGVVFSTAPRVQPSAGIDLGSPFGAGVAVACQLAPDRKSCSVTVNTNAGATADTLLLGPPGFPILVDVDNTAVLGSTVKIDSSDSNGVTVTLTGDVVATVGRLIIASAAQPVVYIGENNQPSGTIKLVESGPGFFSAGPGPTNFIVICYFSGESFTSAPWAIVTTGDLKLQSGAPGPVVAAASVKGTLISIVGNACAYWNVFSASTTASTIEIRGSDATGAILPAGDNNGPRLNVAPGLAPGSSQAGLFVGPGIPTTPTGFQLVSNAIRAFHNNVSVTASSQPRCLQGATDCLAGNIVITETQNGQLRVGTIITVALLPRATTQRLDVLLQTTGTNQTPIVTTNASASGLLVSPVGVVCVPSAIIGVVVCTATVTVNQQSFGPALGMITISNFHYVVAADAVNGPVLVDVTGVGGALGSQVFDSVVSNAIIGAAPVVITTKTQSASAIGKTNTTSAFTVGTKIVHLTAGNNIVTIRIKVDPALIGKSVIIQRAVKTGGVGGTFGAFSNLTTRVIGADGYAYYYATAHSAQWLSFRGMFPGDATHSPSTSQTVQVRWL